MITLLIIAIISMCLWGAYTLAKAIKYEKLHKSNVLGGKPSNEYEGGLFYRKYYRRVMWQIVVIVLLTIIMILIKWN